MREGVTVRNLASNSDPLNTTSPLLTGDVGLSDPPEITSIVGADPDFGDVTVAYGDRLAITFSIATDRGCASAGKAAEDPTCPYAVGARLARSAVDAFFNFSVPVGVRSRE